MAKPVSVVELTSEERQLLERRVQSSTTSQRDCLRARIILLRADGCALRQVARQLGVSVPCAHKWSQRFDQQGLAGLLDQPGRGAKRSLPEATVRKIIELAGQSPPGRQRWSTRTAAKAVGVSSDTVSRLWREQGLKPHRSRTCKRSNAPQLECKFWDVIGLYLDPPQRALVLCCDEKTQCQALERTQPSLPPGLGPIRTHNYVRHGTITLFAALHYLDGKLLHRTTEQHTHVEWLRFLKQIEREVPKDFNIHLIADDYSTHQHAKVKGWLAKRPRFASHLVPTSSSWLDLVERFFADLAEECVRPGSFSSAQQLVAEIEMYLAERNAHPQPYRWKADGAQILAKIRRARESLERERAQQQPTQC